MAGKKSQTPPAPDAGAEGAGAATDPVTGAVVAGEGVPPTSEETIRDAAERRLEERTGNQSVNLAKSEARANGLEGELKKERKARSALELKVADLERALAAATTAASQAGQAIAGLPDNARQLNESVTAHVFGRGGKTPRRAHLKAGDVVLVTTDDADVDELQQELGLQTTVYKVSKETLADLEQSSFLHT